MAQLRPKIVRLAKVIGGASGMVVKIDENAPEYYCMADIVSDDEADIAIAAGLRKERTAEYLAKKVGKTVEEITGMTLEAGVATDADLVSGCTVHITDQLAALAKAAAAAK